MELMHSGVAHDENPPGRGSGRYPWGSKNNVVKKTISLYKTSKKIIDKENARKLRKFMNDHTTASPEFIEGVVKGDKIARDIINTIGIFNLVGFMALSKAKRTETRALTEYEDFFLQLTGHLPYNF